MVSSPVGAYGTVPPPLHVGVYRTGRSSLSSGSMRETVPSLQWERTGRSPLPCGSVRDGPLSPVGAYGTVPLPCGSVRDGIQNNKCGVGGPTLPMSVGG